MRGPGSGPQNLGGFAFAEPCDSAWGVAWWSTTRARPATDRGRAGTKTVHARVPAGSKMPSGSRLKGKGGPGEAGGPDGDLYIVVHVDAHPVFTRNADNLEITVPITFDEAALGGNIKVPVLGGGAVTLKGAAGDGQRPYFPGAREGCRPAGRKQG